jgi:nucleoside-diphosphate-sugar epimerase
MSILITGSSGYFGRLIANNLIRDGIRVVGIDIVKNPELEEGEHFRFYNCSITDREMLRDIFLREQPTDVMHFACTFNKIRDRKKEYEIDIGGSINVLEITNETSSVRRLIYSSSGAIYGADNREGLWLSETTPVNPGKYRYGLNKKLVEEAFFSAGKRDDLHIISLRICTVVGPLYSKPRSVVSLLIKVPYFPDSFREKRIQFMHEEDFVNIMREIIRDNEIEGIFNVAADSYSVVSEVVPGKKYFNFPVISLKPVLWVLWNLKLLNLQPTSLRYSLYPILIDPSKLVKRYRYKFKYSSSESFVITLKNNRLPADSKF